MNESFVARTGAAMPVAERGSLAKLIRRFAIALLIISLVELGAIAVLPVAPADADPGRALIWSTGPDLAQPWANGAAVIAPNDAVYLLGGESSMPMAVQRLLPNAAAWEPGFDIDTQRGSLGAVRSGNRIYLFGGTGGNEGSDESLQYDYVSGDSLDLAKLQAVRYDHGYATDGSGRTYAIGGIGVFDDDELWDSVERYDAGANVWTAVAALPSPLRGTTAIGHTDGRIYVFGGSSTVDGTGIESLSYVYEPSTDSWSPIASMPTATRDSAAVVSGDGEIYVLGGMTPSGATDAVQVYDPLTGQWSAQTALAAPRYGHAAAYDSLGRVLVAGGFDAAGTALATVAVTQRLDVPETAPVIATSPVTTASLDQPYVYDVDADANPEPSYSLVVNPAGMTIDATSGLISWQPADGDVGVHPVTVQASNVVGDVEQSFDVTVVGDTIPPTTPVVTVTGATDTTITLGWSESVDASGIDRYEVFSAAYVGPRFGKRWVYTLLETVTTPTITFTGLTPFTSSRYSVQAVDLAGNRSAYSTRLLGTTLSAPTLSFDVSGQTTGTIATPAKHELSIRLVTRANPAPDLSIVTGPPTMTIDSASRTVSWTPTVADIGINTATFRASNTVGFTDLEVTIEVLSDAPQLSVSYNPDTGGDRFAVAGTPFTAQVNDASMSQSTYELVSGPAGLAISAATGLVTWTPTGPQGGTNAVVVRGTNAGGTTDLAFSIDTMFVGPVTNTVISGTTLLEPTLTWEAPAGEGSDLIVSYTINGKATWGVGRNQQTHLVSYDVAVGETSLLMTGLRTGRAYQTYVTPVDASANVGLRNDVTVVVSVPSLPQIRWAVNGYSGGSSTPGGVVAEQLVEIVLTDQRPDPSTIVLIDGPAGLSFDPTTQTATWTPTAADVTTGYTSTIVTFEATNSVGPVTVQVPIRVFFSGAVLNASTARVGTAGTAHWDPPTDNVTPIVSYSITRKWTWSGRPRSTTFTVPGTSTSISFAVYPTGAVSHKGITITPVDANGNFGIGSGLLLYGATPPPPTQSISGRVYMDEAGNAGLAGVRIRLRSAGPNGIFESGGDDVQTQATTAADGAYLFGDLDPGKHRVSVVTATLPDHRLTLTTGKTPIKFTLASGQDVTAGFGYTDSRSLGSASGRVYMDEAGAPGIAGVRIRLRFPGPNGSFESGGDDVYTRTTTTADGSYSFADLGPGDYRTYLVDSTLPNSGLTLTIGTDPIRFSLTPGQAISGDFGYQ